MLQCIGFFDDDVKCIQKVIDGYVVVVVNVCCFLFKEGMVEVFIMVLQIYQIVLVFYVLCCDKCEDVVVQLFR